MKYNKKKVSVEAVQVNSGADIANLFELLKKVEGYEAGIHLFGDGSMSVELHEGKHRSAIPVREGDYVVLCCDRLEVWGREKFERHYEPEPAPCWYPFTYTVTTDHTTWDPAWGWQTSCSAQTS